MAPNRNLSGPFFSSRYQFGAGERLLRAGAGDGPRLGGLGFIRGAGAIAINSTLSTVLRMTSPQAAPRQGAATRR
jgi:hypothetical protein